MSRVRRYAIVTGGASGLGRALCRRLARDGWHLAICDLNDEGSATTLTEVRAAGGDGQVEHLDVADPAAWAALRARLQAAWPQLDLLVNNAGVAASGDVGQASLDDWHWLININLWNGIYGCHTFVDWLKQNPAGAHIINTASLAAIGSAPGMAAYNVSKAGMLALSETLYAELAPHRVGVTVLCPAFFQTNLLGDGRFTDDRHRKLAQKEFERASFTADDVAQAAVQAMQAKRLYVVLPRQGRMYWYLKRCAPEWFLRRVGREQNARLERAARRA